MLEQENLRTILLDSKNHVLKVHTVYIGSLNSASVRVGELFREAIRANSAAMIVAHNHPSGDPTPSPEDVHVTRQIVEAGKLLDIDVLLAAVAGRPWQHACDRQHRRLREPQRGLPPSRRSRSAFSLRSPRSRSDPASSSPSEARRAVPTGQRACISITAAVCSTIASTAGT